jgi:hypothetical protein
MATKNGNKLRRLAEVKESLRPAKSRLIECLTVMEDEKLDARLTRRLATIIGRLEDLQRRMPG